MVCIHNYYNSLNTRIGNRNGNSGSASNERCHRRCRRGVSLVLLLCLLLLLLWSSRDDYQYQNLMLLDYPVADKSSTRILSSDTTTITTTTASPHDPSFNLEDDTGDETTLSNFPQKNIIEPVSCSERLANRKNDTEDPNRAFEESPKKYVKKPDPHFWISLHNKHFDKMRWNHIYNTGNYYEAGITEQFRFILKDQKTKGLVIDVGMNIGWFSLYSRAMGHHVVGFDPNPIMHTRVCESLRLNRWSEDNAVKTFAYGLGEQTTMLNLTTGNNPGGSSFLEDRLAERFRKNLEVPVIRLDDVAEQEGWIKDADEVPIYLWKLDVEGYEYQVLRGAKKLLHSGRVENILMENTNQDVRQVVDMYTRIYHAGYKLKMISNVQGAPYHPEMIPVLNRELQRMSVGADLNVVGGGINFLATFACNLWWNKREIKNEEDAVKIQ